jgi:nitroreductase
MSSTEYETLTAAAQTALQAPSIFNTQPWLWRVDANALNLYADDDRRLTTSDPGGRFMILSCGLALHHARVALAAAGWRIDIQRLPQRDEPDLLARIRLVEPAMASVEDAALYRAIAVRRTDRRPFADRPVSDVEVRNLVAAAAREGVRLHDVRLNQMAMLAIAVAASQAEQARDPAYRNELLRWTNRPQWSHDGVPQATGVAHAARRVPVRDFVTPPNEGLPVAPGGDRGARYLIVNGHGDERLDWLRAGEAASAVLLTAVSHGLAVAPISDVIEVEHPRALVRGLLPRGGQPYLIVRCGYADETEPLEPVPRRYAIEAIRHPRP